MMSRPMAGALGALAALTTVRLFVAAMTPLAPDEAYYWVWSRALSAGYPDHPGMVALWIRAGTGLVGSDVLGVRLLGPLSAAVGSLLLYDAAERLFPSRRAGLTAALLFNSTLVAGVGSVIMSPDTPLLLFWAATLWAAARIAAGGAAAWWLAAGVFAGLALASKYTAAFLPVGLAIYILVSSPRWLRRREPWLGAAAAVLLFLPVVIWNAENGWVGFLRQGGRVTDWRPERALGFLAELVGGQIGMATPGVFVLFAAGMVMAVRLAARTRDPAWTLLGALSVPPGLVFLQHALGDRVQGNWPAILFPSLAIAAAGLTDRVWRRLVWPSAALGLGITALIYVLVLGNLTTALGGRDPVARQLLGWNILAARAEAARQAAGADFIAAAPYGSASELAWALPPETEVLGAGDHWLPISLAREAAAEKRGILLIPERYGAPDAAEWPDATRLPGVTRESNGVAIETYAVFLVRLPGGPFSEAVLPRR